jgi:alpha-tubulin suppressor-like RCC1 family protein
MARDKNGNVWAWGRNIYGQLGKGIFSDSSNVPVQVKKSASEYLTDIISIDAGFEHSMAIDKDGNVWVWGINEFGQLGLGNTTEPQAYATLMP